jgi:hypothetical protein
MNFREKWAFVLALPLILLQYRVFFDALCFLLLWRGRIAAECARLESVCPARDRGFESHPLRQIFFLRDCERSNPREWPTPNIAKVRGSRMLFFWICLGLQVSVIDSARGVCDLSRADSTEFDPWTPDLVISLLTSHAFFLVFVIPAGTKHVLACMRSGSVFEDTSFFGFRLPPE